ncbi:MAG TPA: glycoside hydrolase family 9 protein [Ignavibacteriaceae bacterium]|nr:glycoside hydrolase family 9 protein [Ignavibacteriaceae bacterium]
MRFKVLILVVSFNLLYTFNGCSLAQQSELFIRVNQVGFLPNDIKTAIVFSNRDLSNKNFKVINQNSKKEVFSDRLNINKGIWGNFKNHYSIDFSKVESNGEYYLEIDGAKSFQFSISNNVYNGIVDSLLLYLRVQRCGQTNPLLHDVCHLYDSPRVENDKEAGVVDVTGGWHDAGDYIKFFSTTAYTTYLLLFSYEFDPKKFQTDNDKNGAPDILEEARVGIDWLLRANYADGKFINQVQDMRDHEQGFRMPENDQLKFDRPAFSGIGKNQIGMFAAVMSLAAKIWQEKFYDKDYADKCLSAAEKIYQYRNSVPDVDIVPSGMYQDSRYWGKLALGAIELYNVTKNKTYLSDAVLFADSAKSDYWWSWGDINALAHYKLAKVYPRFRNYILNNLVSFKNVMNNSVFGEGAAFTWGTTNTLLGVALQAILYSKVFKTNDFDSLIIFQRDYILGKNPWGTTFISNIGKVYPKNFHSQIPYFNGGYLPGAVSAGPTPEVILKNYNITRTSRRFDQFNSNDTKFYDDIADYVTNEPTIGSNATAIFVLSYFQSK